MLGNGGSSAGSSLADPTSPIPSHLCCDYPISKYPSASIIMTSTLRVNSSVVVFSRHQYMHKYRVSRPTCISVHCNAITYASDDQVNIYLHCCIFYLFSIIWIQSCSEFLIFKLTVLPFYSNEIRTFHWIAFTDFIPFPRLGSLLESSIEELLVMFALHSKV